jgi:hypothetical protein
MGRDDCTFCCFVTGWMKKPVKSTHLFAIFLCVSVVSSFHATVPGTVWLFGSQNNDIPEK